MRVLVAVLLLITTGCALTGSGRPSPVRWSTGFWFWQGSAVDPAWSGDLLDALFVQVGTVGQQYVDLPRDLPPAREYWAVFRHEKQEVPGPHDVAMIADQWIWLRGVARQRRLNLTGVQLDVDSPTASLARYADLLRELRKNLPQDAQISITALLDWFRPGTAIDQVIAQVDEFVPQFYDVGKPGTEDAIAARIDAARWGPVFHRFLKRYRIGISSFGRARMISGDRVAYYKDIHPLDLAVDPAFQLQAGKNAAGETVLTYRATRKVEISYLRFPPGDGIQFILPMPDTIRSAVQSVRQMPGDIAGVVFFRWPSAGNDYALQPDEVLDAAGVRPPERRPRNRIHVVQGDCAAVKCMDVYLESAGPLSARPSRYRIRASSPLEYFLPNKDVPVRMTSPPELQVALPAYCGRARLYLGRAVCMQDVDFQVEETQ